MVLHMATWGTVSSVFNARASFKETVHNYFTSDFLGVLARGNIKKVWLIILIPHFDIINPPLSGVLPLFGLWSARNGTHKRKKRLHHLIVMMTLILNIFFFYLNHSDSNHHYNCICLHMCYLLASIIHKRVKFTIVGKSIDQVLVLNIKFKSTLRGNYIR